MTVALAVMNLVIGAVYTSYGLLTIREMASQRQSRALSHFGLAWIAMAFTCGPHHLDHGLHLLIDRTGSSMELPAVLLGLAPGVGWFLLRVEALTGGRGDREIAGTPGWLRTGAAAYGLAVAAVSVWVVGVGLSRLSQNVLPLPNVLLVVLYILIAAHLLRGQLGNHAEQGTWSVSGIALTLIFFTCALMHAAYVAEAAGGTFTVDSHGLGIAWLGVPAAVYFLWVVRGIAAGTLDSIALPAPAGSRHRA